MSRYIMCNLCEDSIDLISFMMHVPKCYRSKCLAAQTLPLCTCNLCKSERSHPGDTLPATGASVAFQPTLPSVGNLSSSPDTATPSSTNNLPVLDAKRVDRLQGKICAICDSPKIIPLCCNCLLFMLENFGLLKYVKKPICWKPKTVKILLILLLMKCKQLH